MFHKVQVIFCEWANEYISTISATNIYSQSFCCKGSWILTTQIETSKIQLNWIQEVGTTNLIQLHSLIAMKYLRITCASEYLNYFNKKENLRQRFRNFMKITQFFIQGANDIFFPHGKNDQTREQKLANWVYHADLITNILSFPDVFQSVPFREGGEFVD